MNQEILKMPKVELHCHLDGSLTLASVREILGKDISPEELQVQPGLSESGGISAEI